MIECICNDINTNAIKESAKPLAEYIKTGHLPSDYDLPSPHVSQETLSSMRQDIYEIILHNVGKGFKPQCGTCIETVLDIFDEEFESKVSNLSFAAE